MPLATKMSLPAPPSYPGNLKPVCGYPRRVSSFKGTFLDLSSQEEGLVGETWFPPRSSGGGGI